MLKVEIITIVKIHDNNVDYSGSASFDGTDKINLPSEPNIGKRYILVIDFKSGEQKILDYPLLYLY